MINIQSLSVFCGSSLGNDDAFIQDAHNLGTHLAENKINIIYGGAKVGLMGAVADAALRHGGHVTGVIPDFIKNKEIAHDNLSEIIVVNSMHARKMIMHEKSDGAIVLPGGFGTLDEMFELLTWGQLGLHKKPIGILNTKGFYNDLISFLDKMVSCNLLRKANRNMLIVSQNIEELLFHMYEYQPPLKAKWISNSQV
jgi:uncharacterized protein (TIGR00730 family)